MFITQNEKNMTTKHQLEQAAELAVPKQVQRVLPEHTTDPKQELFDKYKDVINQMKLHGSSVLVAIYRRPEKTKGGIFVTGTNLDEDIWQGKVGLVLKVGPAPYDTEERKFFDCEPPQVGDWVVFKVSEAITIGVLERKGDCRVVRDRTRILMTIEHPDLVW